MEIVKDSENISTQTVPLTQDQYFAALVEDFKAGEIKFECVVTYHHPVENTDELAKPGNVLYGIEYIKAGVLVDPENNTEIDNPQYLYRGSFQFSAEYEAKLIRENKLVKYLLYMLSIQMAKLI